MVSHPHGDATPPARQAEDPIQSDTITPHGRTADHRMVTCRADARTNFCTESASLLADALAEALCGLDEALGEGDANHSSSDSSDMISMRILERMGLSRITGLL